MSPDRRRHLDLDLDAAGSTTTPRPRRLLRPIPSMTTSDLTSMGSLKPDGSLAHPVARLVVDGYDRLPSVIRDPYCLDAAADSMTSPGRRRFKDVAWR